MGMVCFVSSGCGGDGVSIHPKHILMF
jgi:hypothetical protein